MVDSESVAVAALDKLGFKAADGSRGSSQVPEVEDEHAPDGFGPGG